MLCLSNDSFNSYDVEQLLFFYAPANDITAPFFIFILFIYLFLFIFELFPLLSLFWMLIDTMFARDMYQVYEISDDWLFDDSSRNVV